MKVNEDLVLKGARFCEVVLDIGTYPALEDFTTQPNEGSATVVQTRFRTSVISIRSWIVASRRRLRERLKGGAKCAARGIGRDDAGLLLSSRSGAGDFAMIQ